jgi:hypothetical protein
MRWILIFLPFLVCACSSTPYHELPQTSKSDLIWQLNEGKWTFNDNTLTTPPVAP